MIVIAAVAVLAVGAGAFFGGTRYERNRIMADPSVLFQARAGMSPGAGQTFPAGVLQGGQAPRGNGGGGVVGTIASIEGNTLTLTTQDGATVRVQASDTTLVERNVSGTVGDLAPGEQVVVAGTTNDDGSVTARSITQQTAAFAAPVTR